MRLVAIGAIVLICLAGLGRRQASADEADDILARAQKAHLPKGPDEKMKAYYGKNKGTLYVQGLELEFTQEVWVQQPGKFKEVMDLNVNNVALKTQTVFNGKEGWIKVNDKDIPVKDELLEEFQDMAYMMSLGQLAGFKDKNLKFSLLGEVQVNGKPAVGVKISKEGKKDVDLYFDKATGLMAKTQRRARDFMSGQEVTEERVILEYQDVGDRKIAKRAEVLRDGKKLLTAQILEARVLEKHDDSEFAKPQ